MVKLTMLWFRIYFCFLVIVLSCSFLHAPTFGTSTCWSYSIFVLVRGAIANSSVVAKAGLCQRGKLSLKEEHISNPTSLILKKWRRRRAKRWLYSRSHVIFFDETLLHSTMKAIYFVIVAILSFPTFGDAFTFFPSAKTSGVVTSTPLEWNCLMFRKKLLLMRRCVCAFHVVCAHVCVCAFLCVYGLWLPFSVCVRVCLILVIYTHSQIYYAQLNIFSHSSSPYHSFPYFCSYVWLGGNAKSAKTWSALHQQRESRQQPFIPS